MTTNALKRENSQNGQWRVSGSHLFDETKRSFGDKPVDIFMTCCHGGAAISAIDRLPKNSNVVALAPGNETVSGNDVERIFEYSQSTILDAKNLLDLYLAKALKNRIAPVLATSGAGRRSLPYTCYPTSTKSH